SRRERRRRPVQMIGAEPELREERPRLFGGEPRARNELVEQTLTRGVGAAFLGECPDTRPAADYSPPGRQRHVAEQSPERRGLAAAVRSCDGEALAGHEIERDRAEPEPPTLDDSVLEARDDVSGSLTRGQRQPQLPRLERLLGHLVPLEQPLSLTHLGPERVRGAPVGTAGRSAERVASRSGLAPPGRGELCEMPPPRERLL